MTDLVERLRAECACDETQHCVTCRAADALERLTAENAALRERLAEAVEYGTDYKQAYGIAMANYQAALARLEEAGRVLNHIYATVYNAETRSMIQAFLRAADSASGVGP